MAENKGCSCENTYESEDSDDQEICYACGEWTSLVRCKDCGDVVFESACCG